MDAIVRFAPPRLWRLIRFTQVCCGVTGFLKSNCHKLPLSGVTNLNSSTKFKPPKKKKNCSVVCGCKLFFFFFVELIEEG